MGGIEPLELNCGGGETMITFFDPYRICTPFTFSQMSTFSKTSSKSSNLTRNQSSLIARLRRIKIAPEGAYF